MWFEIAANRLAVSSLAGCPHLHVVGCQKTIKT
jgi:hypothetical protein